MKKILKLIVIVIVAIFLLWTIYFTYSNSKIEKTVTVTQLDFQSEFTTKASDAKVEGNALEFTFKYSDGRNVLIEPSSVNGEDCEIESVSNLNNPNQNLFINGNDGLVKIQCSSDIEEGFDAVINLKLTYVDLDNLVRISDGRIRVE